MKDPGASKTRLSPVLSPDARADLARLLLQRTLSLLTGIQPRGGFDLAVVTGSAEVAQTARRYRADVIVEPGRAGLNSALGIAADHAAGYARLCVLPADLTAPDPQDVLTLLSVARDKAGVVLCPATDGGTNALALSPPDAIRFAFGPHSARRHIQAARAAGLPGTLLPLASLRFDIDTSTDLTRARQISPDLRAAIGPT